MRVCVLFIPTGSLFAFLSFVESLTTNTSVAVFNSVYSATVAWYPTFVFMLAALLCLVPLIVLGYVYHASSAGRKITCLYVTSYVMNSAVLLCQIVWCCSFGVQTAH